MTEIIRMQTYPTITVVDDILQAQQHLQYRYIVNIVRDRLEPGQCTFVNILVVPTIESITMPKYVGVIQLGKDNDGNFYEDIVSIGQNIKYLAPAYATSNNYIIDLFAPDTIPGNTGNAVVAVDGGFYPPMFNGIDMLTPQGYRNVPMALAIPPQFEPGKAFVSVPELYWFEDLLFVGVTSSGYRYSATGFEEDTYTWLGLEREDFGGRIYGIRSCIGSETLPLEYGVLMPNVNTGSRIRCEGVIYHTNEDINDYIPHTGSGGLWKGHSATPYDGDSATMSYTKSFTVTAYYWLTPYREEYCRSSRYEFFNAYNSRVLEGGNVWRYEFQSLQYHFVEKTDLALNQYIPGFPPYGIDAPRMVSIPVAPIAVAGVLGMLIPSLSMPNVRVNCSNNMRNNLCLGD